MTYLRRLAIALFWAGFLLAGCEKEEVRQGEVSSPSDKLPDSSEPCEAFPLLQRSMKAHLFEYPSQAFVEWRRYRERRPALVLVSRDPFLASIPSSRRKAALELVLDGSPAEIDRRAAQPRPNPVMLAQMTLSAALQADLFSEVIWVLPLDQAVEDLDLPTFRRQLRKSGFADKEEAATFSLSEGIFRGSLYGRPFRAVHPQALPELDGPIVLHMDLSFFAPLYKGEIKGPLYPLVNKQLRNLRETGWPTLAVTLSRGHASGRLPLDTRFLAGDLKEVFQKPARLDAELPESWVLRRKALYLENFFKKDKVFELYRQLEQIRPEDPSVQYALYQTNRQRKKGTLALKRLAAAVAMDRVYALEYLDLARMAQQKGLPDQALRMLRLARQAFPDNPFIALREAELLVSRDGGRETRNLLATLRDLPWSKTYFPRIPTHLRNLTASLPTAGFAERHRDEVSRIKND